MIARFIDLCLRQRAMVLLLSVALSAASLVALWRTPIDAIPDLSDVQVIVRASWPGQTPQVIEDQLTYPLTTSLLGVPRANTVRAFSLFGDSFVYVIFEDGTDLYWARSRVLEALAGVQSRLPEAASVELGPDATGVGWVYQYALVDRSGKHDLGTLRSIQDWFLRYELRTVHGVAEVATLGGMERQLEVQIDAERMRRLGVSLSDVRDTIVRNNVSTSGAALELGEAETMIRIDGYLRDPDSVRALPLRMQVGGAALTVGDVANVTWAPAMRRGIGELNGQGEVVGGIVVMRTGASARQVIADVKIRLDQLRRGLPAGVEIVETYDRSLLIDRAISDLSVKLFEEFLMVALVCALFLWHLRSAFVAIICLPLGIGVSFLAMQAMGINANLMSLGGIAIAIGTMVDAAIVMVENVHKHLEKWGETQGRPPTVAEHAGIVAVASKEVGPALFFSLLVVTVSFLPVFALQAQEGRLFAPLAFTKTFAMAGAALLSASLIPVLCIYLTRGKIRAEHDNPLNRWLIAAYTPVLRAALQAPKTTLLVALLVLIASLWPATRLGSEFMPPLDEGDLLYMPSALPGLSPQKASELLQLTDRILMQFPEVLSVHGKAGRAETATDPAPLEMFETIIQLKPKAQWRAGLSTDDLIAQMDAALQIPGLRNVWVQPIRNRIDMLATGVKSPVAIKISGPDLGEIERVAEQATAIVQGLPGVSSVFAERVQSGRYVDIDLDVRAAAAYGLDPADVQEWIAQAVGGAPIAEVIDGRARYPLALRLPREQRDSVADLRALVLTSRSGTEVALGSIAEINVVDGPAMIRSEQARPAGYVYIDVRGRDLGGFVAQAQAAVAAGLEMPAGYSLAWSGQFEYLERAKARLSYLIPLSLLLVVILLFALFGRWSDTALVVLSLPFALIGGVWLLYVLGHAVSVASAVGFIALAGLAAEFGVVMLVYLQQTVGALRQETERPTDAQLQTAIIAGAALRVRPKAMTVFTIIAGLLPIMLGHASGAEAMQRIAAPMLGGMLSAPLLSMLVMPAAYLMIVRSRVRRGVA